jgi:hypothetical protein
MEPRTSPSPEPAHRFVALPFKGVVNTDLHICAAALGNFPDPWVWMLVELPKSI